MFMLPPSEPDIGDLQTLSDAIDTLCNVVDCDRETFIEGLTEIVRRRAEFEDLKMDLDRRRHK
ncbi:hypothetical protein SAMN02799627_01696 [Methylobacterium sp. 13MFTsu3.1M2]|nr:hypothetical protein SAMN02799627_01696 [Methylobacterium sp. 13MFTsu3.1M2]